MGVIDKLVRISFGERNFADKRMISNATYTDKIGKIIHVHGNLDNQIIMGVNDESQIELGEKNLLTNRLNEESANIAKDNEELNRSIFSINLKQEKQSWYSKVAWNIIIPTLTGILGAVFATVIIKWFNL